jgi:hypothetical protein
VMNALLSSPLAIFCALVVAFCELCKLLPSRDKPAGHAGQFTRHYSKHYLEARPI